MRTLPFQISNFERQPSAFSPALFATCLPVQDSKFKVQSSRFKVQGSRFSPQLPVQGSKFKVQGSRFSLQAFTLLDLLALLAVLALLTATLLPALAKTRPNSQSFQCLN